MLILTAECLKIPKGNLFYPCCCPIGLYVLVNSIMLDFNVRHQGVEPIKAVHVNATRRF